MDQNILVASLFFFWSENILVFAVLNLNDRNISWARIKNMINENQIPMNFFSRTMNRIIIIMNQIPRKLVPGVISFRFLS